MGTLARSLPALVLVACAYDWTVGPSDASTVDGAGDGSALSDSPPSGDALCSASCDLLLAQVDTAYEPARQCMVKCPTSVSDECGCAVPVEDPTSSKVEAYVAAVQAYKKGGCSHSCDPCTALQNKCYVGQCT
jgi:hypothetical protein